MQGFSPGNDCGEKGVVFSVIKIDRLPDPVLPSFSIRYWQNFD
jgi:hypothetical protein